MKLIKEQVIEMVNSKAKELFSGWEEAMIWSCLQGHMGTLILADEEEPKSAGIIHGDFCFFAGQPCDDILKPIHGTKLLVPRDDAWAQQIEYFFGNAVEKIQRYAIKKEGDVFDRDRLNAYVSALDSRYELRMIDSMIFEMAGKEEWSVDLCSQFANYADYQRQALGVAILYQGELVAGASPYSVYDGGIEIEIDTKPEYRQQGLATVCGAKLILECLERTLYPSWDAHDLRSVALAEKLGYHMSHPYTTYVLNEQ